MAIPYRDPDPRYLRRNGTRQDTAPWSTQIFNLPGNPDRRNGRQCHRGNQRARTKENPADPEEETYLRNYLEELPELSIDTAQAFAALANGDQDALQSLTSYYMKETAKMAADMNAEEIFLADLIQEANLALIQALGSAGNEVRDEKWLMNEVRKGIIAVLEEQTQRKFADDSLVAV